MVSDSMLAAVCMLVGSFAGTRLSINVAHWAMIHAHQDHRTLHQGRIPRLGGVGMALGWGTGMLLAAFLLRSMEILWVFSCLLLVASSGFYDDLQSARGQNANRRAAALKIASQTAAAVIACTLVWPLESVRFPFLGTFPVGGWGLLLGVLWLVGVSNFFNFMDGANGMAAGTALVIGSFLAWWNGALQVPWALMLSLAMAASALGFLPFNFPSARTFMGDTGSLVLGFGLGLATLPATGGLQPGSLHPALILLVWFPFLADAGLTLLRRLFRGENILQAHNQHLYQRLIRAGHSHTVVSLLYWNLALSANLVAALLVRRFTW